MPQRHERYYFDDGSIILLVEDTLFRVHRYYFTRESQVFADMFSLPTGPSSGSVEGQNDSLPIEIPGVTRQEMESFLGFVYFGMHDEEIFPLESWVALLSFSTRFICDKIRARSVREIESFRSQLDPVERVVLAVQHNVPQWLSGAYQELCQRTNTLSEEEGEKLGLSTVIKLMKAREILLSESDMRGPRSSLIGSSMPRPHGMSSTHFSRMQLGDNGPVRPLLFDEPFGIPPNAGQEIRFNPQRVANVVREVFGVEAPAEASSSPRLPAFAGFGL